MGAIFGLVSVFSIKSSFQPHREYCLILMNYISPRFDSHLPIAKITGEWHTGRQKCFESFTLAVSHSKACFYSETTTTNLKIALQEESKDIFWLFLFCHCSDGSFISFCKKRYVGAKCFLFWRYSRIVIIFFKSRGTPVTWVCMCRCGGGDREYI